MIARKTSNKKGFSLPEVLVTLAITSVVSMGMYQLYESNVTAKLKQDDFMRAQEAARVSSDEIINDIRVAGTGTDTVLGQPVFVNVSPFELIMNADIYSDITSIDPTRRDAEIPPRAKSGVLTYDPGIEYVNGGAETIRWSLDSNNDGVLDSNDKLNATGSGLNTNTYKLHRQVFGKIGGAGSGNGGELEVVAEGIKGPESYPSGLLPKALFEIWINEDRDGTGAIEAGEFDINGNGRADQYLWGDDGSNLGTANNGILEQGELQALYSGNNGGPKIINTYNTTITATNGDTRVSGSGVGFTLKSELANIEKIKVNSTFETNRKGGTSNDVTRGDTYLYREATTTAVGRPRNPQRAIISNPTLVLTSSPDTIQCPLTSSTITSTLNDEDGQPISGATITYTTSSGSFSGSSSVATTTGTTDALGIHSLSFYVTGSSAGFATVNGSATVIGQTYKGIASIQVNSGDPANITVTSTPASLSADGFSTSTISGRVTDSCGNTVSDGTTINFSVTTPSAAAITLTPLTANTVGGVVNTILTAGTVAETATVRMQTGAVSGINTVVFVACNLAMTPRAVSIRAGGDSTYIDMLLQDIALPPNAITNAPISLAFLGGSDGTISPTSVTTNGSGVATFLLTSSSMPHRVTIEGTVNGGSCLNASGTATVTYSGCDVQLTAPKATIGLFEPIIITSTMTNPEVVPPTPEAGVTLTYTDTPDRGSFSVDSGITNGSGQVITTFTPSGTAGTVQIAAGATCGTGLLSLTIEQCVMAITSSPAMIPPDNTTTTGVTVNIQDTSGNPHVGMSVTFSTSLGEIVGGATQTTDASGNATVQLRSTLAATGTATVTATSICGSTTGTVSINDWSLTLSTAAASIETSTSTTLTATVKQNGVVTQPIGDLIDFSFVSADLSATFNPTGLNVAPSAGLATVGLDAATTTGTVSIKATIIIGGITINSNKITIIITDPPPPSGTFIEYVPASETSCGDKKLSFAIRNTSSSNILITNMAITWSNPKDPSARLKKIEAKRGNHTDCNEDFKIYDHDDSPSDPNSGEQFPIRSNATLASGDYLTMGKTEWDEDVLPNGSGNFTISQIEYWILVDSNPTPVHITITDVMNFPKP